ncbi:hypothetical protein FRC10_005871 [Ceratobasidium sp. 414]|nr:hypothetical protein FRC10_005871 [Ceratobasidium sp. 414]
MSNQLSQEQISAYRDAFSLFDKGMDHCDILLKLKPTRLSSCSDDSGTISVDELGDILRSFGQKPTLDELRGMMAKVDLDRSGTIDFGEFLTMMNETGGTPEDELKEAFRAFDKDNSGQISEEELKSVMNSLGERLTDAEIHAMLLEADTDGDGQIDYNGGLNIADTPDDDGRVTEASVKEDMYLLVKPN